MKKDGNIEKVVKALEANNFSVQYLENAADAVPLILDMIPPDASIEIANSALVF